MLALHFFSFFSGLEGSHLPNYLSHGFCGRRKGDGAGRIEEFRRSIIDLANQSFGDFDVGRGFRQLDVVCAEPIESGQSFVSDICGVVENDHHLDKCAKRCEIIPVGNTQGKYFVGRKYAGRRESGKRFDCATFSFEMDEIFAAYRADNVQFLCRGLAVDKYAFILNIPVLNFPEQYRFGELCLLAPNLAQKRPYGHNTSGKRKYSGDQRLVEPQPFKKSTHRLSPQMTRQFSAPVLGAQNLREAVA